MWQKIANFLWRAPDGFSILTSLSGLGWEEIMAQVQRPIAPHLQVYKPQISSVLSILHRLTGVVLGIGALLFAWWLIAAAVGPKAYMVVEGFIYSWIGRLILLGFTGSFFYHLCNGIRHLGWDMGCGFSLPAMRRSGWAVVIAAVILTLGSWFIGYAVRG